MEFPVYVASDCYGEKVNVALRYNPRCHTLDDLYRNAETAFDLFTIQRVREEPLQPIAFAYVFNDVLCQWDLLETKEQLAPCCQVYLFRCGGHESVDEIPEPINLVLQQAEVVAARRGSLSRALRSASLSPFCLASARWAVPEASRDMLGGEARNDSASAADSDAVTHTVHYGNDGRVGESSFQTQEPRPTQSTQVYPVSASFLLHSRSEHEANLSTLSCGGARSHRFRLQLLSPPLDPELRVSRKRHRFIPAPAHRDAVEIPREWYRPSMAAAAAAAAMVSLPPPAWTAPSADLHSFENYDAFSSISRYGSLSSSAFTTATTPSRRPSLSHVVPSLPAPHPPFSSKGVGTPPLHPASAYSRHARPRRGSSILREERDRVEQRMHMSMEDLRASLQEENRGFEQIRSSSRQFCT